MDVEEIQRGQEFNRTEELDELDETNTNIVENVKEDEREDMMNSLDPSKTYSNISKRSSCSSFSSSCPLVEGAIPHHKSLTNTPTGGEAEGRERHAGEVGSTPCPPLSTGRNAIGELGEGKERENNNNNNNNNNNSNNNNISLSPPNTNPQAQQCVEASTRQPLALFTSNAPPTLLSALSNSLCPGGVDVTNERDMAEEEREGPQALGAQGPLFPSQPRSREHQRGPSDRGLGTKGLPQEPRGAGDQAPKEARGLGEPGREEVGRKERKNPLAPWVEVKESQEELTVIIHLEGLEVGERPMNIRIVPSGIGSPRLSVGHKTVNKLDNHSNVYSFPFSSSLPGAGQVGCACRGRVEKPKEGSPNIFKKMLKASKESEGKGKSKPKDTPCEVVGRRGTLDLYGTGEVTQEVVKKKVTSPPQWYDTMWYHIYDVKPWYLQQGPVPRAIPQRLKEKFVNSLMGAQDSVLERMWLNLPFFLQHPNQQQLSLLYEGSSSGRARVENTALAQFYRGAWGKAYRTLTGARKEEVKMAPEEIDRLYPAEEGGRGCDYVIPQTPESPGRLVTEGDLDNIVKRLPRGKACGLSGCSYEVVRGVGSLKKGRESLARLYNHLLQHPESAHQQLYTSRCVGIGKKDGGVRPLCMQECLIKPLHKILASKVERLVVGGVSPLQKCLSTAEGQLEAYEKVMKGLESGAEAVIQFDFSNAFGTIRRCYILDRLLHYQVPASLVRYIEIMLNKQKIQYIGQDGEQHERGIVTGVPQGEPLSMLLFALGIDGLLQDFDEIEEVEVTAYADDVVLVVNKLEDVPRLVQVFSDEAGDRGLRVNMGKTHVGYRGKLDPKVKRELAELGVSCTDMDKEVLTYLGLPVSTDPISKYRFICSRLSEYVEETEMLWRKEIPLQVKYHLQSICLDSKLTYLLKAIPPPSKRETWEKELQLRLDLVWKTHMRLVPRKYWRLPVSMYGVGLFHIRDRWRVARLALERSRKPEGERGEEASTIYYRQIANKWVLKQKVSKQCVDSIPPYLNASLSSPPAEPSMRLDDHAFRIMLATRYCSNKLDIHSQWADLKEQCRCPIHDKLWSLQHVLCCPLSAMQAVHSQHDQLVGHIAGILLRSHQVTGVYREKTSPEQEQRRRAGQQSKRGDLVFTMAGKTHTIDVTVTTSWSETKRNALVTASSQKRRDYGKEQNVHVILFDTAGGITADSWAFLRTLGASSWDLRRMQTIIHRMTARRYSDVQRETKNRLYQLRRARRDVEVKMLPSNDSGEVGCADEHS